jgi:hypothetical protein
VIEILAGTLGKRPLGKGLEKTLNAIEARDYSASAAEPT